MAKKETKEEAPVRHTFTTKKGRGSDVLIFQRPESQQAYVGAPINIKTRAITVRLERGKKFDPFLECGPEGKNITFRGVDPQKMHDFIFSQIGNGHNQVCLWEDRPMSDEEKAMDATVKAAFQERDQQKAANEVLRKALLDAGLNVPEGA
jgi:hypothetical protein